MDRPSFYWPAHEKLQGEFKYDGRVSLSIMFFTDERDADMCSAEIKKQNSTYNGGWFHGKQCGREPERDYTDEHGTRWLAVTC